MSSINIMQSASRHADWLAHRRTVIAGNVANANTPGYRARDLAAFSSVLDAAGAVPALAATNVRHIDIEPGSAVRGSVEPVDARDAYHSGNGVSLDEEMMKAGQVAQGFALNAGVVRSFHRLLLASVRG